MCNECRQNPCNSRCPYADEIKYSYICSKCGEGILNGEEYIVNEKGQYAHFECVDYARDLVNFLGYEIKEMNEEE